jgi:hypothetical protein
MGKQSRRKQQRRLAPPLPVGKQKRPAWQKPQLLAVAAFAAVALLVAAITTLGSGSSAGKTSDKPGPEGVPLESGRLLASANTMADGKTIDGIQCQTNEQVVYHIHAHLAIYVNGRSRPIPLGIGIVPPRGIANTPAGRFVNSGSCYYWLHTHAADGIIHIESPSNQTYTLGQFFDIWRQPLGRGRIGPASGRVVAYADGKLYGGDPRAIQLSRHAVIQLDLGTPTVLPRSATFTSGM